MCFINQKESPQDNYYKCMCVHAHLQGFPGGSVVKNSPAMRRCRFDPWVGKIPWRREWQPTPFLPGKSHGQRSLAGYSGWGLKESEVTQQLNNNNGISLPFKFFRIMPSELCFQLCQPYLKFYEELSWNQKVKKAFLNYHTTTNLVFLVIVSLKILRIFLLHNPTKKVFTL